MNDKLGKTIKTIRESKHLSMKNISDFEVSTSQISRFEKGESEMTIGKFFAVLKNMSISLEEFQTIHDHYALSDEQKFKRELVVAYDAKNTSKIRSILKNLEEKRSEEPQKPFHRVNTIVVKAILSDMLGTFKVPEDDVAFISDYLINIEDWGRHEVWAFGNCVHILSDGTLKLLGSSLIQKTEFYKEIPMNTRAVLRTLLNLLTTSIKKGDKAMAGKYISYLDDFNISIDFLYEKLMLKYSKGYYRYTFGDKKGLEIMKECVEILEKLDCFNKADGLDKEINSL